jgi:hypothetical protein
VCSSDLVGEPNSDAITPSSFPAPLVNVQLDLLVRFIKLARLPAGLEFSHDLFEHFHLFQAALAFVTFDVQFYRPVGGDRNFKFALRH